MKQIKRGVILHRWFDNTTPPKYKFFVVIGEDEQRIVGFFFINTNLNSYIRRNSSFFEMQMSIHKDDYAFLSNNFSYISAHEIKTISKSVLQNEISNGITTVKGNLTKDDTELLIDAVRVSKLFSKIQKERFFK